MPTQPNIPYPGPAWRPSYSFQPKSLQARLATSPNSVQCQWWQALANPSFIAQEGIPGDSPAPGAYIYIPQPGTWIAVVTGAQMAQRYMPQGSWEASDVMLSYDSTVWSLGMWDHICLGTSAQDSRRTIQKESLVRNQYTFPGVGTVTTAGTAVTGVGTAFTQLIKGQIINIAEEPAVIASITNDTHLILVSALSRNYAAIDYTIGSDDLLYWPANSLKDIRTAATVFVAGTAATISTDGKRIVWSNPVTCPGPGVPYSVAYDYFPRYQITDYGIKGQVVNGVPVPDVVQAKLWKPQSPNI